MLIHAKAVVVRILVKLYLFFILSQDVIFVSINIFVYPICRFVSPRHDLNHNEACSCLQVRVSDHLDVTVIDLVKGHVLVVVRVVFFHEIVNELAWFCVRSLLHAEILEVEDLLFLVFCEILLKLIATFLAEHRKQ